MSELVHVENLGDIEHVEGLHYRLILEPDAASKLPPEEAARRKAIQERLDQESSNAMKQLDLVDKKYQTDKAELEKNII